MVTTRTTPAGRGARAQGELRVRDEPALVLHSYPYKETSLIVEAFTRHHGRVALVARGAKRPRSALRGVLLAFRPLALGWVAPRQRTGELVTLTGAEWVGGLAPLSGTALVCGFYLNELLLKLLARDDAHEQLFDAYLRALAGLAAGLDPAPVLRGFEYTLLREAGYALRLSHCAESGAPVERGAFYRYVAERGPVQVEPGEAQAEEVVYTGKALVDIEAGDYTDPETLAQSKLLSRQLLNFHLNGAVIHTRQMMIELQDL